MRRYYIGIIHKDDGSDFGISFPDFPGCVSAGSTLDEVIAMGREALAAHALCMIEDGEAIPDASATEVALREADDSDVLAVVIPLRLAPETADA